MKKVLVACEESQAVCKAFRERGFEAYSCDIQECSGGHPEWHICGDALEILNPKTTHEVGLHNQETDEFYGNVFKTCDGEWHALNGKWDLIIAHPPCTHLSGSGQWAYAKGKDVSLKYKAIEFFMMFADADCEHIAIENPIGIMSTTYKKPSQIISPWQFGDPAEKRTCLWIKGLPKLNPITTQKPEFEYFTWVDRKTGREKRMEMWMYKIRCISNRDERAKAASKTFPGIAKAMAEQWGDYINNIKED